MIKAISLSHEFIIDRIFISTNHHIPFQPLCRKLWKIVSQIYCFIKCKKLTMLCILTITLINFGKTSNHIHEAVAYKSANCKVGRWITSSILSLRERKLFLLKALKVPAIVADSGMMLNAVPPWIMATETTYSILHFYVIKCMKTQLHCRLKCKPNDQFISWGLRL